MKDVTTGTDTRASRAMHEPVMAFDLDAEIAQLRREPAWEERGRTSKTLAKAPAFRIVLTLLEAGGHVGEDDAWSPLAVHVLQGSVEGEREGVLKQAGPGGVIWFSEGPGWSVRAHEASVLLISMTWPEDRTAETELERE
jgi:quercetin dioxygenase-like cupin family protein